MRTRVNNGAASQAGGNGQARSMTMTERELESVLRREIEIEHQELREAVADLEVAARRTFDLRTWIQRSPIMCSWGAFVIGLGLGFRR